MVLSDYWELSAEILHTYRWAFILLCINIGWPPSVPGHLGNRLENLKLCSEIILKKCNNPEYDKSGPGTPAGHVDDSQHRYFNTKWMYSRNVSPGGFKIVVFCSEIINKIWNNPEYDKSGPGTPAEHVDDSQHRYFNTKWMYSRNVSPGGFKIVVFFVQKS